MTDEPRAAQPLEPPPAQPRKDRKRVGRGLGSGKGRYSGRGIKGQKSRAGSHTCGPASRAARCRSRCASRSCAATRRATRCRSGPFRTYYQPVNIRDLARFEAGEEVTPETLKAKGLIRSVRKDVKLLGIGELDDELSISVHQASASAREKVEAAGGTLTLLKEPKVRKVRSRFAPGADEADEPAGRGRSRLRGRRRLRAARRARSSACCPGSPTPGGFRSSGAGCSSPRSCSPSTGSAPGSPRRASTLRQISGLFGGGVFGLLSLFSGGALARFSIFALGIMPYVTASIVIQLLTVAVPSLEQLQQEGEAGHAKITQYTRYVTVGSRRAGRRLRLPLPPQRRAESSTPAGSC